MKQTDYHFHHKTFKGYSGANQNLNLVKMSMQLNTYGYGVQTDSTLDLKLFHDIPIDQLRILVDQKSPQAAKVQAYRVLEKFIKAANTTEQ